MTLRRSPVLGLVCWLSLSAACGTEESGLSDLPPSPGGQGGVNQSGSSGQAGATPGAGSGGTPSGGQAGTGGKGDSGGPSAGQGGAGNAQGGKAQGGNPSAGQAGEGGAGQTGAGQAGSPAAGQAGTGQGGSPSGGQAGGTATGGGGTNQGGAGQTGAGQGGTGQGGTGQGGTGQAGTGQAGTGQAGAPVGGQAGSAQGGMSGSSGQAGGPACDGKFGGACGTCLEQNCCEQVVGCDAACQACLAGDASCNNNGGYQAVKSCAQTSCASACYAVTTAPVCAVPDTQSGGSCGTQNKGFPCNPVTQAGCNQGDTCALGDDNLFHCFGGSGGEPLCGTCDPFEGPFCRRGTQCVDQQCYRYCCDDSDCGGNGTTCNKAIFPQGKGSVGLCTQPEFSGTNACTQDLHEPNDSSSQKAKIPDINDCGTTSLIVGAVEPKDDQDWYTFHVEDTEQCSFGPRFELQGSGVKACYYYKCDNGPTTLGTQVNCPDGSTGSIDQGLVGCCVDEPGLFKPYINCFQAESGTVTIVVTSSGDAPCAPYDIRTSF